MTQETVFPGGRLPTGEIQKSGIDKREKVDPYDRLYDRVMSQENPELTSRYYKARVEYRSNDNVESDRGREELNKILAELNTPANSADLASVYKIRENKLPGLMKDFTLEEKVDSQRASAYELQEVQPKVSAWKKLTDRIRNLLTVKDQTSDMKSAGRQSEQATQQAAADRHGLPAQPIENPVGPPTKRT